jgi:hypothetical protein
MPATLPFCTILGACSANGDGVAEDKAAAVDYNRRAADAGDAAALRNSGLCYENGDGVAEDKAAAEEFYRLSADAGLCAILGSGTKTGSAWPRTRRRRCSTTGARPRQLRGPNNCSTTNGLENSSQQLHEKHKVTSGSRQRSLLGQRSTTGHDWVKPNQRG